jgi:hypothetical protein
VAYLCFWSLTFRVTFVVSHFAALGGGVIQGTASEAVLVVLLAARDRTLRKHGKRSPEKLVVYASDQTHASLQKACQVISLVNKMNYLLSKGKLFFKKRDYKVQTKLVKFCTCFLLFELTYFC